MKSRVSIVNECTLLVETLIVLTDSQFEKLDCAKLRDEIENIAMDLHLCWGVETNGNVRIATIGREYGPIVGNEQLHEAEIAACNFMSSVDKLELPNDDMDGSNLIQFDNEIGKKELEFAKRVLNEWDETDERLGTSGAILVAKSTSGLKYEMPCGRIKESTLKAMFEAFVEKYDHE